VLDKVFYFRDIFDFRDLTDATASGKSVVVIGGGFLGSELSCSLAQQGCTVTQVIKLAYLISNYSLYKEIMLLLYQSRQGTIEKF